MSTNVVSRGNKGEVGIWYTKITFCFDKLALPFVLVIPLIRGAAVVSVFLVLFVVRAVIVRIMVPLTVVFLVASTSMFRGLTK